MDFDKKEFYGIVAKAKKQMQITIDQDCNVADTKPDVEKILGYVCVITPLAVTNLCRPLFALILFCCQSDS